VDLIVWGGLEALKLTRANLSNNSKKINPISV
jgi:hypothetical protein